MGSGDVHWNWVGGMEVGIGDSVRVVCIGLGCGGGMRVEID